MKTPIKNRKHFINRESWSLSFRSRLVYAPSFLALPQFSHKVCFMSLHSRLNIYIFVRVFSFDNPFIMNHDSYLKDMNAEVLIFLKWPNCVLHSFSRLIHSNHLSSVLSFLCLDIFLVLFFFWSKFLVLLYIHEWVSWYLFLLFRNFPFVFVCMWLIFVFV